MKGTLERVAATAPSPRFDMATVRARRATRRRNARVRSGIVGLAVAIVGLGAAYSTLGSADDASIVGGGGAGDVLPPAVVSPQVAADGELYYRAVLLMHRSGDTSALDATTWWSPTNDSGRIEVDTATNYGIDGGRFAAGRFPNHNGIDVSAFPLEPRALTEFLLERSGPDGASPAPLVTPPPDGAPRDGQLWRAITDLMADPHVTPSVRASLLEVAARLQGAHVTLDATDPFERPAHVIEFGNWGGDLVERLYVNPVSHELLAWTTSLPGAARPYSYFVVQSVGVTTSTESAPQDRESAIPTTSLSPGDLPTADAGGPEVEPAGAS
jgi:hypothetical protein